MPGMGAGQSRRTALGTGRRVWKLTERHMAEVMPSKRVSDPYAYAPLNRQLCDHLRQAARRAFPPGIFSTRLGSGLFE